MVKYHKQHLAIGLNCKPFHLNVLILNLCVFSHDLQNKDTYTNEF